MTEAATLYAGRYLGLYERNGWEFVSRTNASAVAVLVAVTDAGEILLVEQYREPIASRTIELPAGLAGDLHDSSEDVLAAARRELLEETGYEAHRLSVLMACPTSAGMSDEWVTFVRATGLRLVSAGGGDSSEDITVHRVPLAGVDEWIESRLRGGTPIDPKIYTALYWLRYGQPNIENA
jgi:ADP-ribose pyrophosphatase